MVRGIVEETEDSLYRPASQKQYRLADPSLFGAIYSFFFIVLFNAFAWYGYPSGGVDFWTAFLHLSRSCVILSGAACCGVCKRNLPNFRLLTTPPPSCPPSLNYRPTRSKVTVKFMGLLKTP